MLRRRHPQQQVVVTVNERIEGALMTGFPEEEAAIRKAHKVLGTDANVTVLGRQVRASMRRRRVAAGAVLVLTMAYLATLLLEGSRMSANLVQWVGIGCVWLSAGWWVICSFELQRVKAQYTVAADPARHGRQG